MFNKETEYALRGLVYIQLQNVVGNKPGVLEIAKQIEAPQSFVAKILQRMVKTGFILSIKGKGGGFLFDKNRPDLPLKKLIIAIEGEHTLISCGLGFKECSCENPCSLHEQYAPIRAAINNLVEVETIQSLAKREIGLKYQNKDYLSYAMSI
jgi:Rrf2 family protein